MISIVIPTYNRGEMIKSTLEALFNQTYSKKNYEILIIDSSTNDETENVVKKLGKNFGGNLSIIRKDGSAFEARNYGIGIAKGDIIACSDDDCMANKDWLEQINDFFVKNKDVIGVEGKTISDETTFTPFTKQVINKGGGSFQTCNLALKKNIFDKVKDMDLDIPLGAYEDHHLVADIMKYGEVKFNDKMIMDHPPRESNLESVNIFNAFKDFPKEYRREEGNFVSYIKLYKKAPNYFKKYMGGTRPSFVMFKVTFVYPLKEFLKHKEYFSKNFNKIPLFVFTRLYARYLMYKGLIKYYLKMY